MRKGILLLSCMTMAVLLGCQPAPRTDSMHPNSNDKKIEIVFEPSSNLPGIADNMDVKGELVFSSFERNADGLVSFGIIFQETEIPGAINYAASTPHQVSGNEVVFTSELWPNASNPLEMRVRIKWNNIIHPPNGYKYAISMNGQTLDPRVRPK